MRIAFVLISFALLAISVSANPVSPQDEDESKDFGLELLKLALKSYIKGTFYEFQKNLKRIEEAIIKKAQEKKQDVQELKKYFEQVKENFREMFEKVKTGQQANDEMMANDVFYDEFQEEDVDEKTKQNRLEKFKQRVVDYINRKRPDLIPRIQEILNKINEVASNATYRIFRIIFWPYVYVTEKMIEVFVNFIFEIIKAAAGPRG
ncbi:uncharacterized protein [Clytia hemisphaerica]|uniref:uncharacterized protein n=1 Tax=Clytia hemisphaerica TaxID=252671 RepID=UPI0034D63E3E